MRWVRSTDTYQELSHPHSVTAYLVLLLRVTSTDCCNLVRRPNADLQILRLPCLSRKYYNGNNIWGCVSQISDEALHTCTQYAQNQSTKVHNSSSQAAGCQPLSGLFRLHWCSSVQLSPCDPRFFCRSKCNLGKCVPFNLNKRCVYLHLQTTVI